MWGLIHTCDTERSAAVGTSDRLKAMQTNLSAVPCLFLPMSAQAAIQNNFEVGYGFTVYFEDGTDVQVGDRLTWNGTRYLVRGRQAYPGFDAISHLSISAESEHSSGN